jgi:hypothetical protein
MLAFRFTCAQQAMEVDEKPSEEYSDIGGLDKQIQEVLFNPHLFLLLDMAVFLKESLPGSLWRHLSCH